MLLFFWFAFRAPKLVPRGMQNLGELGLLFVRDQILRPQLGKAGDKWLPFLMSLFFFIWVNNIMGIIPILYFPAMAKYGYPLALAAMVWLIYMGLGYQAPGCARLHEDADRPVRIAGVDPAAADPDRVLLQRDRPAVHAVGTAVRQHAGRACAAAGVRPGHLVPADPVVGLLYSASSFVVLVLVTALEVLVQALQAFIFTILTATYISGAYEGAH